MLCPKCRLEMVQMGIVAGVSLMPYFLLWQCSECGEQIKEEITGENDCPLCRMFDSPNYN